MMAPDPNKIPTVKTFQDTLERLGPYGTWPFLERRVTLDRRLERTRLWSAYLIHGRRSRGRRQGENENIYVDRYQPKDILLAVTILVLNILDAILTIHYVGDDLQREANPFARYLLELGYGWFIFGKAVVVALCILFLAVHKNFRLVRPALLFLLAFYGLLLCYHLYLQWVTPRGSVL